MPTDPEALRAAVRERYAAAVVRASEAGRASGDGSCCGPDAGAAGRDPVTAGLYAVATSRSPPGALRWGEPLDLGLIENVSRLALRGR